MQNLHAAETPSEAKVSRRVLFHEKETWQRHCNLSAGCAINDSVTVYGFPHECVYEVNQKGASQSHTLYYPQVNRPLSPVARRLKYWYYWSLIYWPLWHTSVFVPTSLIIWECVSQSYGVSAQYIFCTQKCYKGSFCVSLLADCICIAAPASRALFWCM